MEFIPLASDTDSGLHFRVVRRIHASCITEAGNITSSSVYMASFFEAEVYFASVSKWIDNLKIVPIGGITSHMTYGQTDLDNLFLRVLRKFFLFYFR
ncbi:hypothetical protein RhiirA5_403374 [Rhizophagus irregularis]|uniref:Uncharacterized protein n=1 Tax=Rhizophagus irregularis TaxID=588596 RepID=A0A2N0NZT6_9GLOM|nr:hypothetical protein RhiirA5_403374 [Rhizophagus irregularis]